MGKTDTFLCPASAAQLARSLLQMGQEHKTQPCSRDLPKFPFHLRDAELRSVPAGALTTPKEQPIIIIVITGTDC